MQYPLFGEAHSLLVPSAALGAPAFQLCDGAPAPGPEQQHGAAIGGRHLPQLGPETLVVGVHLAPSLPRQTVDLPHRGGARSQRLLLLQLQVKLHRLLHPLAPDLAALSGLPAAADLEGENCGEEEDDEGEEVGDRGAGEGGEKRGGKGGGAGEEEGE
ncbi:hypothetical protein RJ640_028869 [Escallonia rubra]|uniref:Uncharacterized protein n=1 Tax=Escallonia rubra TaxID=112253 RepID=A0AA88UFR8_9ASTE|nr:hypothetical protein RJ640_028869 [Escallonia rubra]